MKRGGRRGRAWCVPERLNAESPPAGRSIPGARPQHRERGADRHGGTGSRGRTGRAPPGTPHRTREQTRQVHAGVWLLSQEKDRATDSPHNVGGPHRTTRREGARAQRATNGAAFPGLSRQTHPQVGTDCGSEWGGAGPVGTGSPRGSARGQGPPIPNALPATERFPAERPTSVSCDLPPSKGMGEVPPDPERSPRGPAGVGGGCFVPRAAALFTPASQGSRGARGGSFTSAGVSRRRAGNGGSTRVVPRGSGGAGRPRPPACSLGARLCRAGLPAQCEVTSL